MKRIATMMWVWGLACLLGGLAVPARAGLQEDIARGYSLIDQWRIDEAEQYTQSLAPKYPNSGDVLFLLARVEFYKADYAKALAILELVEDAPGAVRDFKKLVTQTQKATAGFVTRQSEHFIFRYADGPDEILVHYAAQALEKSYSTLGRLIGHFPKKKVVVEIYPDRVPFSRISPLTLKDILTSGTVALCKYNRIMLISPGSLVRGYNWMDTLSHEFTHYLLSAKSHNNVPLWLHEGIAKYFESRWRKSPDHLSPIMETVLADGLANDYLVDFEDMMPSFAKLKTAEDVQLAYAEVATMVDYMVHLKGETVIAALVEELRTGTPVEEAVEHLFQKSLDRFQADWKVYMKGRKLQTIPGLTVLRFQFKNKRNGGESQEEKKEAQASSQFGSKRVRDLTLLGDILKSRNYIRAAILEYEKAIAESKILSPVLYNKLAATYMAHKQYGRAEKLLQNSLKYYPMFPTTLTHLGEIQFLRKNFQQAEDYFRRAERLNPFNPMVHLRLIRIHAAQGHTAQKEMQEKLYDLIK